MAYTKQTWTDGQTVYASQMTHIEDGIEAVEAEIPTDASDIGAIASPASPANGAFLVWNGTAWVAQTLSTWSGGTY